MKPFITAAQAAVAAYADRLVLVENGTDVAPGMAGFDVESNGARTLIWADVATFPAVQFDHPDGTGCDVDPSGGSHRHDFSHTLLGLRSPFPGGYGVVAMAACSDPHDIVHATRTGAASFSLVVLGAGAGSAWP